MAFQEWIPAMNRMILGVLALGCFLALGSGNVRAELLTFDNLAANLPVPAGYGGLNWSNLTVNNAAQSGLVAASPPNVAFAHGDGTITPVAPGTFTFESADFAAAENPLLIAATGFRGGNLVYNASFTIYRFNPTFETLNFRNIDSLKFSANAPPGFPGLDAVFLGFAIDNFTTGPQVAQDAPEPGSLLLCSIGVAATGLAALRQRRPS